MSTELLGLAIEDRRFKGIDRFALMAASDAAGHISAQMIAQWANEPMSAAEACLASLIGRRLVVEIEDGALVWAEIWWSAYASDRRHGRRRDPSWSISKERRAAIYARDGHACVYCGSIERLSIDHRTPRSRGGGDSDVNLATCCRPCNSSKGALTVEEWRP